MKTRMKKLTTMLLAGVVMIGLVLGTGSTAKAADPDPNKGTETDEATAYITKDLFMDPDVATPVKSFTFTQTKVSLDDETTTEAKNKMPDLTLAVPTTTTATSSTAYYCDTEDGTYSTTKADTSKFKDVPIVSADLVHGASGAALTWPHAGEYVYTIEEDTTTPDSTIEYSQAKYKVTVYVANGAADGDLYVAAVGVVKVKNDDGTQENKKVDATPDTGISGKGSQFAFRNTYTPLSALQVEKKVDGTYADQTKTFKFTTTLTLPSVGKTEDSYTAYVCNAGGTTDGTAITFSKTDATPYTQSYELKHGQYLQFGDYTAPDFTPNLPVGTTYTVVEDRQDVDYILSAKVKTANGTNTDATSVGATITGNNTSAATGDAKINEVAGNKVGDVSGLATDALKLAGNKVEALNTYKTVTPTGILLNNLPFILMILVAVGGIVVYLKLKRRQSHR